MASSGALRFSAKRLLRAACDGDIGGMRAELARKASPERRRKALDQAFQYASHRGQALAASYLIDAGVDLAAQGEGALAGAAKQGRTETVAMLLDRGVDPKAFERAHNIPLGHAAQAGHVETTLLLLERGAWSEPHLALALRWACYRQGEAATGMVRALLKAGALSARAPSEMAGLIGSSASPTLGVATIRGNAETARLLIDAGAKPETLHPDVRAKLERLLARRFGPKLPDDE